MLEKIWEYSLYFEQFDDANHQVNAISLNVLIKESPITGWATVMNVLSKMGKLDNVRRFMNASCYEKEYLNLLEEDLVYQNDK